MNKLVQQSERFRHAADIEAETQITAGPPILKKWWVKRAAYLSAIPTELADILREVYPVELTRYSNGGVPLPPIQEPQSYEYDSKAEAIPAAREFYRKDLHDGLMFGQRDLVEKAEAGLRLLEQQ